MAQVIGAGSFTQETINALLMNPGIHSTSAQTLIYGNIAYWRLITYAGVLAMTITAPVAGDDDFKRIEVLSASAFAHTVTAPSALFAPGTALKTVATFAAFAGAGFACRVYQGKFIVEWAQGITWS